MTILTASQLWKAAYVWKLFNKIINGLWVIWIRLTELKSSTKPEEQKVSTRKGRQSHCDKKTLEDNYSQIKFEKNTGT